MAFFTHQDIRFHYRDEGTGVPFVFQHGLGRDVSQPFSLLPKVPGYRFLAFDCRAHGQTKPIGNLDDIGLTTFADDLVALLDHLRIGKAVVGGISMGAAVALNFSLRYPETVAGLVLSRPAWLDTPNPWNVMMFTLITTLIRQHGAVHGQALFRRSEEYRETYEQWPLVAQSMSTLFEDPEIEQTAFKFERIIKDTPCRDRREWHQIRVPTLILANRADPIHPFEYGEVLRHGIPGAEFREISAKAENIAEHEADVRKHLGEFLSHHREGFQKVGAG